jgi:hypothetical protein
LSPVKTQRSDVKIFQLKFGEPILYESFTFTFGKNKVVISLHVNWVHVETGMG